MAKYEPGKLALIVGASTPEGAVYIGHCVELVEHVPANTVIRFKGNGFCTPAEAWIVKGNVTMSLLDGSKMYGYAFYRQSHLMPLEDGQDQFKREKGTVKLLVHNRFVGSVGE